MGSSAWEEAVVRVDEWAGWGSHLLHLFITFEAERGGSRGGELMALYR